MRLLSVVLLGAALSAAAQVELNLGEPHPPDVASLAEPQYIQAHKQQDVVLAFQVRTGLHINSNKPGSSYLLPTVLMLEPVQGLTIAKMQYPAGKKYSFSFAPKEELEVYTDLFQVHVPMRAAKPGSYVLRGTLRFQSCDNAACFPPQTVPVKVGIEAK